MAAASSAGPARGDRGKEQGHGGLVAGARTLAGRFMERGDRQAAAGETGIDRLEAEGQAIAPCPLAGGFERPHLRAQGGQAFGSGGT